MFPGKQEAETLAATSAASSEPPSTPTTSPTGWSIPTRPSLRQAPRPSRPCRPVQIHITRAWSPSGRWPSPATPMQRSPQPAAVNCCASTSPRATTNAGSLVFDADGMLLVSLGDGGAGDDQGAGHVDGGNGQDPSNVLGSILRLDPQGADAANGQYGIRADNPFVDDADALDEIFAYGFRNPFRMSFDRATGDLYVGDVGQRDIEEVDVVTAGGNYGWPLKEGSFCFGQNGSDPGFAFDADPCPGVADDAELIDPVAEYNHASREHTRPAERSSAASSTAATPIPALAGRYVFGDFTRFTDSGAPDDGSLFTLAKKNLTCGDKTKTSRILEPTLADRDRVGYAVLGFGEDADGEVYLLGNDTDGPVGDTGVVLRLFPAS